VVFEAVCEAIRWIRRRLVNPPCSAEEMIAKYESHGLAVRGIDSANAGQQFVIPQIQPLQLISSPATRVVQFYLGLKAALGRLRAARCRRVPGDRE